MDCADAQAALSRRLDGAPTGVEAAALEAHLASCAACRALARDLAVEDELLAAAWPPLAAPAGFADRVVAALPPRGVVGGPRAAGRGGEQTAAPDFTARNHGPAAPSSSPPPSHHGPRPAAHAPPPAAHGPRPTALRPRRLALAAALLLALLAGGALGQGPARAGLDLVLRQVGLRESPPPAAPPRAVSLERVSLEEAQRLVPWPIRRPDPALLPDGYRLIGVRAGEIYTFAAGPVVVLNYGLGDAEGETRLAITQFRAGAGAEIVGPVAPGAARTVPVGSGTGLFIEGLWVARDGGQVWERGALVRLIVEDGDRIIQFDADPRAGWDAERLAALAAALH